MKLILKNFQDFFTASSGKRKRDDFAARYQNGQHIPQQDGAMDPPPEVFQVYFLHLFLLLLKLPHFIFLRCE